MIVLSMTSCPLALRGDLTKWMQEIDVGVYVGRLSARVRDELWLRVQDNIKDGRAIMVYAANNEQGLDFRVHNTDWIPIDLDGFKLMLRPAQPERPGSKELKKGFSKAATMRKVRRARSGNPNNSSKSSAYVVLDVETTGTDSRKDEIIEMAALTIEEGIVSKQFQCLVKTDRELSPTVTKLTGITAGMLDDEGQELSEALPQLIEFIGELPVVGHNIDFDYDFIRAACRKLNLPKLNNRRIDTLEISRRLVRSVRNHKLPTLLQHFQIETHSPHRGLADCYSTQELYLKLKELAATRE